MLNKKAIIIFLIIFLVLITSIFYFRYQVYYSRGSYPDTRMFVINKGDGNATIAANLQQAGLISGKIYFYYYVRTHGLLNRIMPGDYNLAGRMTIPEIAEIITNPQKSFVKITFPEGLTFANMAKMLDDNGFDGAGFLDLVKKPDTFRDDFAILADPNIQSLEGYLFPDTYYFAKDATAEGIISKMLNNFSEKITPDMATTIKQQGKSLNDEIILASIIQQEVPSASDMQVVSGIFWNRIGQGMPLQSDATLTYILGDDKSSHTVAETKTVSPYNTYINKGLPPSAICNPGLDAISAAIYPKDSNYMYFLSNSQCGTLYAQTLDQQDQNKAKCGL